VSALTQLAHEGPRSLVNCSPHVELHSALSTNVGGLGRTCPVDIAIQN